MIADAFGTGAIIVMLVMIGLIGLFTAVSILAQVFSAVARIAIRLRRR